MAWAPFWDNKLIFIADYGIEEDRYMRNTEPRE